ncbi:LysR family transcriptional regulator [Vibrio sp. Of14-4]|uniref:LysR family transcriptional regulator n=1 Tax=Vibrio sp. Of14-4 TaxID=2724878 RepID=UPI001EF1E8A9|nr:LysR family transcriptional regulator [Vibrio sp. Of14-4]MCG7491635.1 LysR family transcriptional regulator [Vibrio sp. Of14-4]
MRHMIIFTKIVETGSITAAARDLGVGKSVISQHLKALEEELEVLLLRRSTRQLLLTPIGVEFFERCKRISALVDEAWDVARVSQIEPKGSVKISSPHALIEPVVSPAIGHLVSIYPDLVPTILANDGSVDLFETGADIAIHLGGLPSSDYKQRRIGSLKKILCASPTYIQNHDLNITQLIKNPSLLHKCDYVANIWEGKSIHYTLEHSSSSHSIDVSMKASRFNDSVHSVIAMVKAGAGMALIPEFMFENFQRKGELENVYPGYTLSAVPVYAVHNYGSTPPLNTTICTDFIERQLRKIT